jgi:hypothetical protein
MARRGHVVGTLRSEISKLAAQHHAIKTAPAPLDDAKRQCVLVETLSKRGTPRITTQGGTLHVHGWSPEQVTGPAPLPVIIETLAWVDPDVSGLQNRSVVRERLR